MARKYLRDIFFDVNGVNSSGMTKLQQAIRNNDLDRVQSLLKAGADANLTDTVLQYRPLTQALAEGRPDIVKALLDHTAKIDFDTNLVGRKRQNHNPLSLLVSKDLPKSLEPVRMELIKMLLEKGADPFFNLRPLPSEDTPIHEAIRAGNTEAVKMFCEHKPRALSRYFDSSTLAFYAVQQGEAGCLKIILDANPLLLHVKGSHKKNPLLLDAVRSRNLGVFDVVLNAPNVIINGINSAGDTALHLLAKSDMPLGIRNEMIAKLIKKGASPALKNRDGDTPLHILARASISGDSTSFEIMISALKDPKVFEEKDYNGHTALFAAAVIGSKKADGAGTPLTAAIEIIDLLLDAGADPNAPDLRGYTALDRLAERGDRTSPVVQRLLVGGGDYDKMLSPDDFKQQKGNLGKIQGIKKKKAPGFKF